MWVKLKVLDPEERFEKQHNSNFMEKSLDLCSCSRFQLKKRSHGRRLREDRISSLPDDVLLVITSLLPFKEVVKTSILSRRWLNLWVHSPVLHFHAPAQNAMITKERERRHYVKWVNRFLRRHKGQFLKEFKIFCDLDVDDQKDIDSWLVIALAKKVECLELNLSVDGSYRCVRDHYYVFPGPFLNFGSGEANSVGGKRQFVQSDFSCLKSLSLQRVDVTGEAVNFVLVNCPFLERLEVVGSSKLVKLVISDPTLVLKYLKINYCDYLEVLSISNLINLVSLDIKAVGDLTLTGLPMLVELFIHGFYYWLTHCIAQASSCFSYLEALTLSVSDLKDAAQLSKYDKLTKLKRLVISVMALNDDPTELISIVNACPRLEEFVFMVILYSVSELTRRSKRRGSSLKSKSLKVFEYVGYQGHATDAELIMLVVENAASLEEIIIHPRDPPFPDPRNPRISIDSLKGSIPPHIRLLLR